MATTTLLKSISFLAPLLLNWPFLGFLLLCIFLYFFKDGVDALLKNSKLPVNVIDSQTTKNTTISNVPAVPDDTGHEYYKFIAISSALVPNTVTSLFGLSRKKELQIQEFMNSMIISPEVKDIDSEKQAIFQALLKYGLIEEDNNKVTVTKYGKKFLMYKGYAIDNN